MHQPSTMEPITTVSTPQHRSSGALPHFFSTYRGQLTLFVFAFCLGFMFCNTFTSIDRPAGRRPGGMIGQQFWASLSGGIGGDDAEGNCSCSPSLSSSTSSSTSAPTVTSAGNVRNVDKSNKGQHNTSCSNVQRAQRTSVEDFVEAAHRCTDKSTKHLYEYAYGANFARWKYQRLTRNPGYSSSTGMMGAAPLVSDLDALSPEQRQNAAVTSFTAPNAIKIFEIGLGCTMKCAAGGFQQLRKYWKGQLHYVGMEYDFDRCVKMWDISDIHPPDTLWLEHYVCRGDQGNLSTLHACLEKHGPFDVIIDDGSHIASHMVTNFEYLFPKDKYLKPGGVYFLEDLSTQFSRWWIGYGDRIRSKWHYPDGYQMVQDIMSWKLCNAAGGSNINKNKKKELTAADRLRSATYPPIVPRQLQDRRMVEIRDRCPYMRFPYHGWSSGGGVWDRLGDVACDNEICVFQKHFES